MKGAAVSLHLMVSKRTSATPFHFDSETLEVLSDLNNIRIFTFPRKELFFLSFTRVYSTYFNLTNFPFQIIDDCLQ